MSAPPLTIFVHIGAGKTGTSALQRHLSQCRAALAQLGLYYPVAAGGAEGIGHDSFGKAFINDPLPAYMKPVKDPAGVRAAMRAELATVSEPAALISTEQLELADPNRLRGFFDGLGRACDIRVLYMVRSPDEALEAEYNQIVKLGRTALCIADYAEAHFRYDILDTARRWEAAFGPGSLTARVYDAARPLATALLFEAMGRAGDEAALPPVPQSVNRSVGIRALTLIRLWTALGRDPRVPHTAELKQDRIAGDLPALFFDAGGAAAFRARFAETIRGFSTRYLGRDTTDLGGRRYSDAERDDIRRAIRALRLDRF